MIPTTEPAIRISNLFRRRLTTHWAEKEVSQYRKLVKAGCFDSLDDLKLVEQYYAFERRKGPTGVYRRELYTFVNNFQGELDRAREWRERHPVKPPPRKIIPMPPTKTKPYVAPTDAEELAQLARFEAERRSRRQQKGFLL